MKNRICQGVKQLFQHSAGKEIEKSKHLELDLREEYANAFRTESYNEFWERVIALSNVNSSATMGMGSTSAAYRLPSYRLFVDHLLDPDQPTVTRILALTQIPSQTHILSLLSDYFSETANASFLCSHLLKDIGHTRIKYKSLKSIIDSLQIGQISPINQLSFILSRLAECSISLNPFIPSGSTSTSFPNRIQVVQANCSDMLKRLESCRVKTEAKLRLINKLKRGSAVVLVALTASLTIIVAAHALAVLVAAPGVIAASLKIVSAKKLRRSSAQLDAAAKGAYILIRDLDTISRVVARLNDELEHMRAIVQFWLVRGEDKLQASGEVARQLKLNDLSFREQLDELEEHLYLCFMTLNRARSLALREIVDQGLLAATSAPIPNDLPK